MGVSGSGKTTVGQRLAARLGWQYAEADTFHPATNVEKMRAGIPLTDADRWPWLDAIATWIQDTQAQGRHGVVTCSALKRSYRQRLATGRPGVRLVYLQGPYEVVAARMAARQHEYMPLALLRSQFDTLEEPGPEEEALVVSIEAPVEAIVDAITARLGLAGPMPS